MSATAAVNAIHEVYASETEDKMSMDKMKAIFIIMVQKMSIHNWDKALKIAIEDDVCKIYYNDDDCVNDHCNIINRERIKHWIKQQ